MKPLYGKKVILYPMVEKDYDYFFEVYGQEENKKLYQLGEIGDSEAIKTSFIERQGNGEIYPWIVYTIQGKASRKVGIIFVILEGEHRCNINGVIDKIFLKGLAQRIKNNEKITYTEDSIKAVIKFCFKELQRERIEATIEYSNRLAINLMKKVGFRREGILKKFAKIGDAYLDIVIMALLKEEYKNG